MTLITVNYTLKKDSFYLYKFPFLIIRNTGSSSDCIHERLTRLFIEHDDSDITELDLDLKEVDWEQQTTNTRLKQVYLHYNKEIIAEYL
tara:strand:- start:828 stop:1094 length:267 start_codon:yes stop_codon:yes gene_type:complete